MVTCLDMPTTVCSATFTTSMFLANGGWTVILDDSVHKVYAYALSTNHSNNNLVGGCPYPAYRLVDGVGCKNNPEIGLPIAFGDPGGNSRFHGNPAVCNPPPGPNPCTDLSWHIAAGGIRYSGCPAESDPGYPAPNQGDVLGVGGESPSPPVGSPCPA